MKRICLILVLAIVGISPSYCQLLYINISDSSSYQCESTGETIFPKLGLKKNKDLDLFFRGQLIFNKSLLPDNYTDMQYEILNDTILFITFIKKNQTGVSHPMFIEREDINIICLNNPHVIYQVNLKKRKVVEDMELLKKLHSLPGAEFYAVLDFNDVCLTLISNKSQTEKIKVTIRNHL